MAIYHCSIQVISRNSGRSSVAAAAYRSGEILHNKHDGVTHDFTRKGGVQYTEIILPEHAPKEYQDRETLWNAVEAVEKNIRAQTAREIEISLPVELSREQQISLVHEYVHKNFVDRGMIADIAIHDKNDGNPHAHIMLTMRSLDKQGRWQSKQRKEYIYDELGNKQYDPKKKTYKCRSVPTNDWDSHDNAEIWREAWANNCNRFFIDNTINANVDHRSYKRQGLNKIPTVHLGAAHKIEKRGIPTDRGFINKEINDINQQMHELEKHMATLDAERAQEEIAKVVSRANKQPRTDIAKKKYRVYTPTTKRINLIQYTQAHTFACSRRLPQYLKLRNLKDTANTLNFLSEHGITSYAELNQKRASLNTTIKENQIALKRLDFEIRKFSKIVSAIEDCNKTIGIVQKIQSKLGASREKYRQENESDFMIFQTAIETLKKNGFATVPKLSEIQDQRAQTISKRQAIYDQYTSDKQFVVNVAHAKKNLNLILHSNGRVASILRMEAPEPSTSPSPSRGNQRSSINEKLNKIKSISSPNGSPPSHK